MLFLETPSNLKLNPFKTNSPQEGMHFWSICIDDYFTVHLHWSCFLHVLILPRALSQVDVDARLLSVVLYPIPFLFQRYPLGICFQRWLEQHHLMHLDNIVKRFFFKKNETWNDNHSACSDHKTYSHFQKFWCEGSRDKRRLVFLFTVL